MNIQAATLCQKCTDIDLENDTEYYLSQLSRIRSSAQQGCPGCNFFIDIMGQRLQGAREEWLLLLRRPDLTETRVILYMINGGRIMNRVVLRLCSPYGKSLLVANTLRRINESGSEPLIPKDCEWEDRELGRIIAAQATEPQALDLAKQWLHQCTSSHGQACALEKDAPSPTRLIYVPMNENEPLSLRHTRDTRGLLYVALSYCWGRGSMFKTTPATLKDRLSGFSTSDLPQVLQDAVYLTREFGLQWIWIDALCIIQGDAADWSYESALMADTYGNATFVIAADLAHDVHEGIFLPRNLPISHRFGIDGLEKICLQLDSGIWSGIRSHPLASRGWAFQERILAPRVLHFLNDQMAWECNTTLYRESVFTLGSSPTKHFGKPQFAPHFHQKRTSGGTPTTGYGDDMDLHLRLECWNFVVSEIKFCRFTVESDTLPAISGLATAIQVPGLGQYFAGIWEYNPFVSMVWHSSFFKKSLSSTYKAPSWSWVSANNPILWFRYVLQPDLTTERVLAWRAWDVKFGPRLLHQDMKLKSEDPKGEVLDGSFMIMSGFCRYVYIAPDPREGFKPTFWYIEDQLSEGLHSFMDQCDDHEAFIARFEGNPREAFPDAVPTNEQRYLCVQVAQEKSAARAIIRTLALILEAVEGTDAFRRVGILLFVLEEQDHSKWSKRDLKLV